MMWNLLGMGIKTGFQIYKNKKETTLELERFDELKLEGKELWNIMNQSNMIWEDTLQLNESGVYLFSTKKKKQ